MATIIKCVFKGCLNVGTPDDGFDFFVCKDCERKFWLILTRYTLDRNGVKR